MTAQYKQENMEASKLSTAEYWARRGPKTAAFLLVIPGAAVIGLGFGLLWNQIVPDTVIGFGVGLLIWGLVVALSD